ncbi:MAG: hypothetical protein J6Y77_00715 [Paludibacteraceae bacterium]|nr:hypothetical protein [Paludibacteraceae bacterium]
MKRKYYSIGIGLLIAVELLMAAIFQCVVGTPYQPVDFAVATLFTIVTVGLTASLGAFFENRRLSTKRFGLYKLVKLTLVLVALIAIAVNTTLERMDKIEVMTRFAVFFAATLAFESWAVLNYAKRLNEADQTEQKSSI